MPVSVLYLLNLPFKVSALLSLVGPAQSTRFYHLLHLNVMCFDQIKFDLI